MSVCCSVSYVYVLQCKVFVCVSVCCSVSYVYVLQCEVSVCVFVCVAVYGVCCSVRCVLLCKVCVAV